MKVPVLKQQLCRSLVVADVSVIVTFVRYKSDPTVSKSQSMSNAQFLIVTFVILTEGPDPLENLHLKNASVVFMFSIYLF
jgi:hypothetical protein